jgi:hypothetical protein
VSVEYLDLADYIAIAAAVTGLDLQTVMNITNHDLADSALHAQRPASATPTSTPTSSTRQRC